jgi:hypothetical protein
MQSIENIANTLVDGVDLVTHFAHAASIIVGVVLLVMAVTLFKAHRYNPKYVPLEKPIVYVLLGAVLVSLPFFNILFGSTGSSLDLKQQSAARAQSALLSDEPAMLATMVDIDAPLIGD